MQRWGRELFNMWPKVGKYTEEPLVSISFLNAWQHFAGDDLVFQLWRATAHKYDTYDDLSCFLESAHHALISFCFIFLNKCSWSINFSWKTLQGTCQNTSYKARKKLQNQGKWKIHTLKWWTIVAAKVSMISCVGGVGIPSNRPQTCWFFRIQNLAPCMTMTTKSKHVKMLPCTSFRSSECSAEICTVSFTLPRKHQGQGSGVSSCANSKMGTSLTSPTFVQAFHSNLKRCFNLPSRLHPLRRRWAERHVSTWETSRNESGDKCSRWNIDNRAYVMQYVHKHSILHHHSEYTSHNILNNISMHPYIHVDIVGSRMKATEVFSLLRKELKHVLQLSMSFVKELSAGSRERPFRSDIVHVHWHSARLSIRLWEKGSERKQPMQTTNESSSFRSQLK